MHAHTHTCSQSVAIIATVELCFIQPYNDYTLSVHTLC